MIPDKAFILAAGFGKRLRPYTEHCPKPLVEVAGRSLIERTLDHLGDAGVQSAVVNTHYLGEMLKDRLENHTSPTVTLSHEDALLDTGGGIKNALEVYKGDPFFVLSGDGLWEDAPTQNSLQSLSAAWDPDKMDILMLLQPVSTMRVTRGVGDYDLDESGRAIRSLNQTGTYMFTSMRINHPRIFDGAPDGAFSYLELMDKAQSEGRLYGLEHTGLWHHISTPEDLDAVNAFYTKESRDECA